MKSLVTLATALALMASLAASGSSAPRGREPDRPPQSRSALASLTLSVVGTNDLHGGIAEADGRGGLALLSGYLKNLRIARERDRGAVLLVDAGDMFQGTLEANISEGASVVDAYNVLGYAAAAIGNHEFDYGPIGPSQIPRSAADDPRGALKARAAGASFPFLAANLIDNSTGEPVDWPNVRPTTVVTVGGVTVGIIGGLTRGALSATIASNTVGLRVAPLGPAIATHAARLRAAGATVVIATVHAGGRCSRFDRPQDLSSCEPASEIVEVARALPYGLVNAIVGGHTHAGMAHEVNGIPIIQSFSGGRAFGRVDLTVTRADGRVTAARIFPPRYLCTRENPSTNACAAGSRGSASAPARYEGEVVRPDPAVVALVARALEGVNALRAMPLGVTLDTSVARGNDAESPLGNLLTDAFRESVAGADLAINNTFGGIRADLPRGPLTYGSVYNTFPFDNRLVTLRLTGADVRRVFAAAIRGGDRAPGISGLRVRARCTGGGLDVSMVRAGGAIIQDTDALVVVTTDFLALGGDGVFRPIMPPQGFALDPDAPLAREVLVAWLKRRGGRLSGSDLVDTKNPRWLTPETQSIRCSGR
jgi:2',3'-cyclic-nucleotide 2'-phosphodiesterase (5'-nucleotidase family)